MRSDLDRRHAKTKKEAAEKEAEKSPMVKKTLRSSAPASPVETTSAIRVTSFGDRAKAHIDKAAKERDEAHIAQASRTRPSTKKP